MKRWAVGLGSLLLLAVFAFPVFARGPGWGGYGMGYGQGMGYGPGPANCPRYGNYGQGYASNLTPEQRTQLDQLRQKFYTDTANLRNELWAKNGELNTLLNSPNPDPQKAQDLQRQVSDLKGKMAQSRVNFELDAKKIAPEGAAYADSGPGYGPGYGPRMGRGFGPGTCWNY